MQRFDSRHPVAGPHQIDRNTLRQLIEITGQEDVDLMSIAEILNQFPGVAVQIRRQARSMAFNTKPQVENENELRHAIALIGLRRLRAILDLQLRQIEMTSKELVG